MHAPRGANAHFTLGLFGAGGGFGMAQELCATDDVLIGVKVGRELRCLPFNKGFSSRDIEAFQVADRKADSSSPCLAPFAPEQVRRTLNWATDTWEAPGVKFAIATAVGGIPDPDAAPSDKIAAALLPGIPARLTIDNLKGKEAVQGFFAVGGMSGLRMLATETGGELIGAASSTGGWGFAVGRAQAPNAVACGDFDLLHVFRRPEPIPWCLSKTGCIVIPVPPGKTVTVDIALGWHREGRVSAGTCRCSYAYAKHYPDLASVLRRTLSSASALWAEAEAADRTLLDSRLNEDQRFCIAQSTRAYWGSSVLLDDNGRPRWVVNEGTYLMMNTFDLAVDHLFFELRQHPWTVRNVLDSYADTWGYRDTLHFPETPDKQHPGGVSFCHDQGIFLTWSPPGWSSYEITNQEGCFSHMTQEQLVNWVLCAASYVQHTGDDAWLGRRVGLVKECLESMLNRDHPDPRKRDGIMDLDSSRCGTASEITTYDSLDPSLGQARRNLYLAVKGWATYVSLEWLFRRMKDFQAASEAQSGARRAAATIARAFDPKLGFIPAIMDGKDKSPIIPAVEGLVFPARMGLNETVSANGPYGEMVQALKKHLEKILKPGTCIFPDGGWKLSANSDNSWISKVFLCQYVARSVLGMKFGKTGDKADRAHADWWRVGCPSCPGIDQIFAGKQEKLNFFYPRAVTSILWLDERKPCA